MSENTPETVSKPLVDIRPTRPRRETASTHIHRRTYFKWLAIAVLIGVAGWLVVTSQMAASPLTLLRDSQGNLVATSNEGSSLALQAASINATNGFSSTHATSHTPNAAFPCARIAIINFSDHPLMQLVGKNLPEKMSPLDAVERVDYYPANTAPPAGERSPDLWITLDADDITTSGLVPRLGVQATIRATAGRSLGRGSFSGRDSTSPPIVDSNWNGSLEHKSTTTGVSSNKYLPAVKNIVESLAGQLTTVIQELHDKHGSMPPMHESFYPVYTPTADIFKPWSADLIVSSHGFMFSNETYWRTEIDQPIVDELQERQARFEQDGWQTRHFSKTKHAPHLSMTRGAEWLDVYPLRRQESTDNASDGSGPPSKVIMRYANRMNRDDMRDAIDRQLDVGGPLESLLLVSTRLTPERRGEYVELLRKQNPTSSQAWLTLAGEYQKLKHPEQGRAALRRAHWLGKLDPHSNYKVEATKKLAKQLKCEELPDEVASPELFEELGIAELKVNVPSEPVEVAEAHPAFFYAWDEQGVWHVVSWRIEAKRFGNDATRLSVAHAHVSAGSSSWGSGQLFRDGEEITQTVSKLGRLAVVVKTQPNERFRVVVKIEPKS